MGDRKITTKATGEASAPPDEARVLLSASAYDPDPSAAREAVAEQARGLHELLEDAGVPGDRIKTEQFSISQEWPDRRRREAPGGEGDRPKPYHASQRTGVTVLELDRLDEILVEAVDVAGVGIKAVDFGFRTDKERELEREAIADAVGAAREKAAAAVRREAGRLGDAVSIVTDDASGAPQPAAMRAGDSASPSITSGPMETRVRVEVTYEIEAG